MLARDQRYETRAHAPDRLTPECRRVPGLRLQEAALARTFLTTDHHNGHAGILSPGMDASRPFASVTKHDETLFACWDVVAPGDTL